MRYLLVALPLVLLAACESTDAAKPASTSTASAPIERYTGGPPIPTPGSGKVQPGIEKYTGGPPIPSEYDMNPAPLTGLP